MSSTNFPYRLLLLTVLALLFALAPAGEIVLPAAGLLVLWLPGAWALRCVPQLFQRRGRFALELVASNVLAVVTLHLLWLVSNDRLAIWGVLAGLHALLIGIAWLRRDALEAAVERGAAAPARWVSRALVVLAAYVACGVLAVHVLPRGFFGVAPNAAHDYIKHHAVLWSLEQGPLPLESIFYSAEESGPYHYYEFQYYPAAAIRVLTLHRVDIPFPFGLTSATAALALILLVFQFARRVLGSDVGALLAAACVSVVGGWDAIPIGIAMLDGAAPRIILDSWVEVPWRLHNLLTQYLWCPQHVMALAHFVAIAWCLLVMPRARAWLVIAPLTALAMFGSSVYLAMLFFPVAAIYVVSRPLIDRAEATRWRGYAGAIGCIAVAGALMMLPQLLRYLEISARLPGGLTLAWERNGFAFIGLITPAGAVANWLDAPWLLTIELGLPAFAFLLMRWATWRQWWAQPGMRLLIIAAVLGGALALTVRSSVNPYDYSFRLGVMPVQILGAVAVGALVCGGLTRIRSARWRWTVVVVGVALGLPVGLYELPLMAARTYLEDAPHEDERIALLYLRRNTPKEAVVFADPERRRHLTELTDRQMAVLDPDYSHTRVFWPRDPDAWIARYETALELLSGSPSPAEAHATLRAWGVTHIYIGEPERERCGDCSQFRHPRYFRDVYDDGETRVIAVRNVTR